MGRILCFVEVPERHYLRNDDLRRPVDNKGLELIHVETGGRLPQPEIRLLSLRSRTKRTLELKREYHFLCLANLQLFCDEDLGSRL